MKRIIWIVFVLMLLFLAPPALAQSENPPVNIGAVSAVSVIAFCAAGMSLLFDYFPVIAAKYDKLSDSSKQLWAIGSAVIIVAIAFGLTCAKFVTSNLVCTTNGAYEAITGIIYVIAIQYAFHKATKPTTEFKENILKIPKA